MTAGVNLRGGLRGALGLIALMLVATIARGQTPNPLRYEMQPAADSVAPWAQRPQVTAASYDPPPLPDPSLSDSLGVPVEEPPVMPIMPREAPPFHAVEPSWPDEPPEYDPHLERGLRGKAAHFRQTMRNWLGIGFDHSERYIGMGDPLTDTSWLNRPWSIGSMVGIRFHDHAIGGVEQGNSAFVGLRLGRDFDPYWGLEGRFSYSNPDTYNAVAMQMDGDSHNYFADVSVMYYPWGDSRWRPYFSAGVGSATYRFSAANFNVSDSLLYMPLGLGVKYFQSPWFSLRFDAAYELGFGSNRFDAQNSFTLAAAAEVRFGGRRRSYFPWDGGTILW